MSIHMIHQVNGVMLRQNLIMHKLDSYKTK